MTPLPQSTPSRQSVDATGIAAFLDAAANLGLHSLMILRHGHVIASGWWAPYGPDRPHHLYSLSKSFTSTAAGLAAADGLLDLDATVLSYFPEWDADVTDPRSRAMLVRHIASMSSGHLEETWPAAPKADPDHPVRGFLRIPPDQDPGTVFTYNQSCTYTLATIAARVTGQPLLAYLRRRLFDVIGIGTAAWEELPPGQVLGFSGLYVTTDAIARLGELYLRGGQWDGRQVLPAAWVAEATRKHIETRPDATPDWRQGYGFQFWMSRHGYRGDGARGQFCLVLPEQDAVVAITAGTNDMQAILDAAWDHLLPAFGTGTVSPSTGAPGTGGDAEAADKALAERLGRLRLVQHATPAGSAGAWPDAASAPVVLTPADGAEENLPPVRRVQVADRKVTMFEDTLSVELHVTGEDWHITEDPVPVAASGGWTDPATLAVDVVFVETPHRLVLTCSLADGTFSVRWEPDAGMVAGLRSLAQLRSPRKLGQAPSLSHAQGDRVAAPAEHPLVRDISVWTWLLSRGLETVCSTGVGMRQGKRLSPVVDQYSAEELQKAGRLKQIRMVARLVNQQNKRALPIVFGSAAGVIVVLVLIGLLTGLAALLIPVGVLLGLLTAMILFGRFAQAAQYSAIEGQVGAAAAVLQSMRGDWTVTPGVAANRTMDVVHRAVGKPGVVLVGEGAPARVAQLLANERKKTERVAHGVPIHELQVGNGEGQIPVSKLQRTVTKLQAKVRLKPPAVADLNYRLKALQPTMQMPKGPLPKGARMPKMPKPQQR